MTNHRIIEIQGIASSAVASSSAGDGPSLAKLLDSASEISVSRNEAIRIAHGILTCAERERLTLAENEARRGIQWDDG